MKMSAEIIDRFMHLQSEARDCDPLTMTLASVDERGRPTQRTITLIQVDPQGLVFFTDSRSRKACHFTQRPYASLCVYWHQLHVQIEFDGSVEAIDDMQSDIYWGNRERDGQISAWASHQSKVLTSKQELLDRVETVKNKYRDLQIPRPAHWLCYRIIPERVEFWKSGWQRLHERVCYDQINGEWKKSLLNP
jgi:pyridoxamine 5'-phosphate oxidase